jgi:anthranilate phosphoribosyltransferase
MKLSQAINAVLQHQDLNSSEMTEVMRTIMTGGATDAQIGGF